MQIQTQVTEWSDD